MADPLWRWAFPDPAGLEAWWLLRQLTRANCALGKTKTRKSSRTPGTASSPPKGRARRRYNHRERDQTVASRRHLLLLWTKSGSEPLGAEALRGGDLGVTSPN